MRYPQPGDNLGITFERLGGSVWVARDDLIEGGTKARFLPALIGDAEEVVFGGPFFGGAPLALAAVGKRLGRKVTLFYAARKRPGRRQAQAVALGAEIRWVAHGRMTVVQARAREYAARSGALFLPLGFDVAAIEQPFVAELAWGARALPPIAEVWCASGTGFLARCLGLAFPSARVTGVAVGLRSRWAKQALPANVRIIESGFRPEQPCWALAPFPACPYYERKAWALCSRRRPRGGLLFWNVVGD